jgi:acetolactate synthase-1/2/3 large subunit
MTTERCLYGTFIPKNEQAAGFCADAYAGLHGIGRALVTSGPGATNISTPIGASNYDAIPVISLAGQVNFKSNMIVPRNEL